MAQGFSLVATRGTARALTAAGLPVKTINKVLEGRPHVVDALKNGEIHLVFNTTDGAQAAAIAISAFTIWRTAGTGIRWPRERMCCRASTPIAM